MTATRKLTLDEQVQISTGLRFALQHGCLSPRGMKHDDPLREYTYQTVKECVVKERVNARIYSIVITQ